MPQNSAKVAQLKPFDEGGCAASARDAAGVLRALAMPRKALPFNAPAIKYDERTGRSDGRAFTVVFKQPNGRLATVECWLPKSLTARDLANAIKDSKRGHWGSILSQLRRARELPETSQRLELSPEVQALRGNGPPSNSAQAASFNEEGETCADVTISITYKNEALNFWHTVTITFTICITQGGADGYHYSIDQGFSQFLVLEASRQTITQLDSVEFNATFVTQSSSFPWVLGWAWSPTGGSDPWTQPCNGSGFTCKIQVHGSGVMSFALNQDEVYVQADAGVFAAVPEDVGEGLGDAELPDGWDEDPPEEESVRMSGPFASELSEYFAPHPVAFPTGPISASKSYDIFVDALSMGEWRYTQGCYRCGTGSNTEPARNLSIQYGDCTDFVWSAVKHVLGGSWNHEKLSTFMFNTYGSARLGNHGYVQVDSASVRAGDVVVRAKTSDCYCGHAGVFVGWGAGGHPIGWANNGRPATPTDTNEDRLTTVYDFKTIAGRATKFFRPITP